MVANHQGCVKKVMRPAHCLIVWQVLLRAYWMIFMQPVCLYLATPAGSRPQWEDSRHSHRTGESLWRVSPSVPPGAFGWAPASHGRCGSRGPQSWPTSGGSRLDWCLRMQNCAKSEQRLWIRNKTEAKSKDRRGGRAAACRLSPANASLHSFTGP